MCPTEQPENVEPTIDEAPEAEPLDGRDSQPVAEGSSDDPRTLEAGDPLRDPAAIADETGLPGGDSGLHGDTGLPPDDASTTPPRGDELGDALGGDETGAGEDIDLSEQGVSTDLGAEPGDEAGPGYTDNGLPDGSGDDNPAHRRRPGDDENRFDAG